MMITHFQLWIRRGGHPEPCNKVGYQNLAKSTVGYEQGTFQFWTQRLKQVFQIALRVERNHTPQGKWGIFLLGGENLPRSDFDDLNLFQS